MNKNDREILVGNNRFYLDDNNIINIIIDGDLDKETAISMRVALIDLLNMVEGKSKIFVDNNRSGKPSLEARRIFKEMSEYEQVGKIGILNLHPVARVMASFVVGLSRNKDIKFFNSKERARGWLMMDEMLESG